MLRMWCLYDAKKHRYDQSECASRARSSTTSPGWPRHRPRGSTWDFHLLNLYGMLRWVCKLYVDWILMGLCLTCTCSPLVFHEYWQHTTKIAPLSFLNRWGISTPGREQPGHVSENVLGKLKGSGLPSEELSHLDLTKGFWGSTPTHHGCWCLSNLSNLFSSDFRNQQW